jgi:hypothetical protein
MPEVFIEIQELSGGVANIRCSLINVKYSICQ